MNSSQPNDNDAALIAGAARQVAAARREAAAHGIAPLDAIAARPASGRSGPLLEPESLSGYEILGEHHRGGQGVVYRAVQRATRRNVAIKVLNERGWGGDPAARVRFEREVQILGQLRHPNVVAIHDSSESDGRFYYVMDFVEGQPIDAWIAQRDPHVAASLARFNQNSSTADALASPPRDPGGSPAPSLSGPPGQREKRSPPWTPTDTVRLFAQVCDAVQAAHVKGVIHRDLKPGNILIDEQAEPRIVDFGLAKLSDSVEDMTQTGQFLGSMPWSSPEQVAGDPALIDTRTDVYALGVVLYQIVCGRFPYGITGSVASVLQNIREVAPTPPSRTRAEINDELETIILRCLQKEPARRYQTAGELGRDLRRYLSGEPIDAKRDSVAYLLRKHLRRYRLGIAIGGGLVAVLAVSLMVVLGFWRQAQDERDAAESARRREATARQQAETDRTAAIASASETEAITEFLQSMLAAVDPQRMGRDARVIDVLNAAAARIEVEFADRPRLAAQLLQTVGRSYLALGAYDLAAERLRRAADLFSASLGAEARETLGVNIDLSAALQRNGEFQAAETHIRRTLAVAERVIGPEHANTLILQCNLGLLLRELGRLDDADALLRDTLAVQERVRGAGDADTLMTRNNIALVAWDRGCLDQAEEQFRSILTAKRSLGAAAQESALRTAVNLAAVISLQGRNEDAEALFREIADDVERLMGPAHPLRMLCLTNLGTSLAMREQLAAAEPPLREAAEIARGALRGAHPEKLTVLENLAEVLGLLGDATAAAEVRAEIEELRQAAPNPAGGGL